MVTSKRRLLEEAPPEGTARARGRSPGIDARRSAPRRKRRRSRPSRCVRPRRRVPRHRRGHAPPRPRAGLRHGPPAPPPRAGIRTRPRPRQAPARATRRPRRPLARRPRPRRAGACGRRARSRGPPTRSRRPGPPPRTGPPGPAYGSQAEKAIERPSGSISRARRRARCEGLLGRRLGIRVLEEEQRASRDCRATTPGQASRSSSGSYQSYTPPKRTSGPDPGTPAERRPAARSPRAGPSGTPNGTTASRRESVGSSGKLCAPIRPAARRAPA